ncbi:S-layer homology domain-containing protein [Geobacillus stearothermophilus]|nr:hypothetical protein GLN3_08550 [Geobacillus lituanicus]MED4298948.1 S-layer homology domain-containing protein [Geobacillus stearothermophilus]
MRKPFIILLTLVFLMVWNLPFAFAVSDSGIELQLSTDKQAYYRGDKVTITGKIIKDGQPVKGGNPTLLVTSPSSEPIFVEQWNENEFAQDGTFSTFFTLDDRAELGDYTVKLAALSQTKTVTFSVKEKKWNEDVRVSVTTDKSSYYTDESVLISGTVTKSQSPVSLTDVTILISKDDEPVKVDQRYTSQDGKYESFFNLSGSKPGTYKVKVKALDVEAETTFTVSLRPSTPPPGGGGIPVPTPPVPDDNPGKPSEFGTIHVDEKTGEKKLVVEEAKLNEAITNPAVNTITMYIQTEANEKFISTLSVEMKGSTVEKVANNNKQLKVVANNAELLLPADVLRNLSVKTSLKIAVSQTNSKSMNLPVTLKGQKVVSDVFDFTLYTDGKIASAHFSQPVTVSVPLTQNIGDSKKAAAYYLNETNKQWEYVGGKLLNGKWVFKTNHFSKYAVIENNKTFNDIQGKEYDWVREYIESLASRTIIKGKSEDVFAPNANITRAQFAVLLARALQLPKQEYQGVFSDVPKSVDWAALEIEAASRAGIIKGSNGKFRPYENITREQMAAMIIRAIEYKNKALLDHINPTIPFADKDQIDSYAKEYVGFAWKLEIINGTTVDGKTVFAPKDNATRAQAAKMLYKLLEIIE